MGGARGLTRRQQGHKSGIIAAEFRCVANLCFKNRGGHIALMGTGLEGIKACLHGGGSNLAGSAQVLDLNVRLDELDSVDQQMRIYKLGIGQSLFQCLISGGSESVVIHLYAEDLRAEPHVPQYTGHEFHGMMLNALTGAGNDTGCNRTGVILKNVEKRF